MHKNAMDASGLGMAILYFVNHVIPLVQPLLIFVGVVASLVWYGIRFFDRYKYGHSKDDD